MTAVARPAAAATVRAPAAIDVPEMVVWALGLLMAIDYLGLTSEFGILKVLRVGTLLAYGMFAVVVAKGGLVPAASTRQGKLLLGLMGMAAASIMYGLVRSYAPVALRAHVDYFVLFVVSASVVDRRSRVTKLAVVATAIILVLVARNVEPLTSSMRVAAFKAGVFMGDGNDFAWGLVVLIPFIAYLIIERHNLMLRLAGVVGLAAAAVGVVGTQSRGGTLAVGAAMLYYILFVTKRRGLAIVIVVVTAVGAVALAPSAYVSRMQTVSDYEDDNSARSRLQAWGAATRMALDYPLGVGAGNFNSAYGRYYMPDDENSQIEWASGRWLSAHSVYFKVLGEYGFPGLLLFLLLIVVNFRENRRSGQVLASINASDREVRPTLLSEHWPAVINMSLVGYAVAAIFLGGLAYPHLFLLSALTVSASRHASLVKASLTRPVVADDNRRPAPSPRPFSRLAPVSSRNAVGGSRWR